MDRLRIALLALGLAVCIGASAATAATASAAVPGWELATANSAANSSSPKVTSATCPSGKQALGAGVSTSGGAGQIGILMIETMTTPPGSMVLAYEDQDGFSGTWSQLAAAVCANPLPGLERVYTGSVYSSAATKVASVSCPAGKRVIAAEVVHTGAAAQAGEWVLDDLRISGSLTSVTASSHEDQDGTPGNWSVVAHAVCAFPPPGLELVTATGPTDSIAQKTTVAGCPAGKRVLGAGGEITGGFGQVRFTSVLPISFFGDGTLVSAAEDQDGNAAAWSIKAYAVCATA